MLGEELERTNVLVHCIAGVSRSATVVMAFLMKTRGITFQQAHRLVKSRRPIVPSPAGRFTPTHHLSNSWSGTRKAWPLLSR